MYRLGLLISAAVLCTSTVFAQNQPAKPYSPAIAAQTTPDTSTNPEPWRIIPKPTQQSGSASSDVRPETGDNNSNILVSDLQDRVLTARALSRLAEVEQLMNGNTCYSIRSYLMARDSKDSDSTHLVSTSTCQPAQRYTVKTTDPQPHLLQR